MPKHPNKTPPSKQRAKRAGLIAAAIFLAYVVIGFWILPPLVKPRIEEQLSSMLGSKVTVDQIKLNPLSLSATLSRLIAREQDGEPFAGFETLFVNTQLSSIFSTHMEITDATVRGVSSEPSAMAEFNFNGSIDQKASIAGTGQMNPMTALQYSKVNVSLRDFALQPVSPYAGKFIGFKIADGTLETDLKYIVDHDQVKGDNIITIDQLELGDKVDSPDALNLPVQLGVTLLKDKDGRIALQVPVTGNVKDPHFDFAKVVVGALTGAIKNVASAPFATLPKIDGFTGERLRTVEFDFGSAELHDGEARKLDALATYLVDRKDLTLGIEGTADRRMDVAVLLGVSPADLSPKDDQETGKASPSVPAAQMVDEEALRQLAAKRAEAVHTYLIGQTNLEAARVRLKPVQVNAAPDGEFGLVVFSLSIE